MQRVKPVGPNEKGRFMSTYFLFLLIVIFCCPTTLNEVSVYAYFIVNFALTCIKSISHNAE